MELEALESIRAGVPSHSPWTIPRLLRVVWGLVLGPPETGAVRPLLDTTQKAGQLVAVAGQNLA